jgi:hypothetical protein
MYASQTIKEISLLLAKNRARNNASNNAEFLSRRPRDGESDAQEDAPSCARTDAKPVDRDLQMKYDVARNEDGPLRSTLRIEQTPRTKHPTDAVHEAVLESRLRDIEDHLAVRYGTLVETVFLDLDALTYLLQSPCPLTQSQTG